MKVYSPNAEVPGRSLQNLVAISPKIYDQSWSQEPAGCKENNGKIFYSAVQGLVAKVKDTVANG